MIPLNSAISCSLVHGSVTGSTVGILCALSTDSCLDEACRDTWAGVSARDDGEAVRDVRAFLRGGMAV